jgi:hypothetical protein
MGKKASYNDAVPNVKIVIQHTRQIEEGEQRYRNIAKIFLENSEGERFLAPTIKPGVARVYGRLIAEGDKPHGERWNHVTSLVEEYQKMGAFVRATRNGQFNESAQRLVNEGINHYQGLRETLSRMTGHRGYNTYFESWTPSLMEEETEENNLNELFVQETLDPRIESVMPILNKLQKKVAEMKETNALSEWADNIIDEGAAVDAYMAGKSPALAHFADKLDKEIDEGFDDIDDPVVSSITRRIIRQHPELLKHGPDKVLAAIADVADFVGDVEEIGSSDVSGWVKQVARQLNGVDEGMMDTIKKAGSKVFDKLGGGSEEDLLKDLQKKAGVPQTGKKPEFDAKAKQLARTNSGDPVGDFAKGGKDLGIFKEDDVEESALQASFGIKKYGKKGMDKLRAAGQKHASEKTMQNIRAEYSDKEKPVTEDGEFAGNYATGEAGQWRNKGPKANKPATIGDLVGEGQEELDAMMRLLGEGWKGELAGGTLGGVSGTGAGSALGALAGGPVGAAIGGVVGGAAGGTAGQMAGRELTKEEQLNEVAPLLAAGARAIMPLLAKVGPKLGQMASGAGKAGAEVAGKTATGIGRGTVDVAKSAAGSAAQNAGQIGVGVGAYQAITDVADKMVGGVGEVYRDVGKAAGAIAQSVGDAIDGKTIAELASAAVKYSIPIGIILAVLYGGKKLIDQVMSEGADDSEMGALGKMVGSVTPNPSDFAQGFKKTFEGQDDLDTIRRLLKK